MLRIVHPAPEGQGPRTPKGRRRRDMHSLTRDERRHLRAALENLHRAYGTWACLAEVMGVSTNTLTGNYEGSPGLALRAARAGGMSVEAVLSGVLSAAGRCETCGSRLGHVARGCPVSC
jgi:hypothetical protein